MILAADRSPCSGLKQPSVHQGCWSCLLVFLRLSSSVDYYPEQPAVSELLAESYAEDLSPLEGPSTSRPRNFDSQAEPEESCPVCGDKVSGYHYGLLTCESCKGFFKRSVQNNKRYTCAEQQSCAVHLSQRKRCPYCRFQKCLAVGMKTEAVRADRMRGGRNKFGPLYRRDRQIKQQTGQANAASGGIKAEATQSYWPTSPQHCPPLHHPPLHGHASTSGAQPFTLPAGLWPPTSLAPVVTPPALPYPGIPHQAPHGYQLAPRSFSRPLENFLSQPGGSYSPSASSTCSTPGASASLPQAPPSSSSQDFLTQLLEGEQDESQQCAKVVACLQREQANRGKHDCLNTFSIMCKMADQTLFGLVEWARNSALFKELKVEDQMLLLQRCWSELLVLDHLCRQVTYGRDGCIYLVTGQQIELSTIISQAGAALSSLVTRTQDLVSKLKALQFDRHEFVCLKYLVLFNPDVKSLQNRQQVEQTQERVNRVLMEHTQQTHPGHSDKFGQLLLRLPEVRSISLQVEEYLYKRHVLGDLPCNSLLSEMLHTKQA
ncbi:nuclear receptor subfamily 5, group A, member 5 isoform X1 [Synchiropus splendidus]|uniref:nuclear receptor subfamily 5, group A, member 5 isoform X1 n=1 Tax=Synchiropus splendidus TaxID=270530 RepID=UPI00237EB250|nr:nuclear receptor subfamily 5, group A, member 5 isoform X1 [Synchiropus splendidus]